jgi:hypothetical protein
MLRVILIALSLLAAGAAPVTPTPAEAGNVRCC